MPTDKLNDARIRAARPGPRAVKLFDGGGLYLFVSPTGAKTWRVTFRIDGRAQQIGLGAYPAVGLAEARKRRADLRQRLAAGQDPRSPRLRPSITVGEAISAFWGGRADIKPRYRDQAMQCMQTYIVPTLGTVPLRSLTREQLLEALNVLDRRGKLDYVRKARVWVSVMLDWAVEQGHAGANVAKLIDPRRAFRRRPARHFAAVDVDDVQALWARLLLEEREAGLLTSILACRFLALTWVRTGEMLGMPIAGEFDLARAVWTIPAARMKVPRDHVVPLSTQAVAIVREMLARSAGGEWLWSIDPARGKPISEGAVLALLKRIGYHRKMTGHGWRAVGSSWAREAGYADEVVEMQLAHAPRDKVQAAYNRARYLDQRRVMLQAWGDWLG